MGFFVFSFLCFFFAFQNFEILTQKFQMQQKLLATKNFVLWVEKNDLRKLSNKKIHSTFNNRKMLISIIHATTDTSDPTYFMFIIFTFVFTIVNKVTIGITTHLVIGYELWQKYSFSVNEVLVAFCAGVD